MSQVSNGARKQEVRELKEGRQFDYQENDKLMGNRSQSQKKSYSQDKMVKGIDSQSREKPPQSLAKIDEDSTEESKNSPTSSLEKEVRDAVANVLHDNSSSTSVKEISMLSESTSKSSKSPKESRDKEQVVKKSPLIAQIPAENAPLGEHKQRKYSTEALRSLKHQMMQGTLKELKKSTTEGVQSKNTQSTNSTYSGLIGSNNTKAPFPKPDKKQVAFAVDETVCGLVIGKGGVNVKKLEKTFDVEIIVNAKKSETATKRIVTIIGSDASNIDRARKALEYQQVFIPILGLHQKLLVAKASEDKFQRWRTDTGVVRIEYENDLEDYNPINHRSGHAGYGRMSNREIIRQKKVQSNEAHNGFLRLVGTKEAVVKGQSQIEAELEDANKAADLDIDPRDENIQVHNVDTNYSRSAAHNPSAQPARDQYYGANSYQYPQPYKPNPGSSMIYQLWQQQQQQQQHQESYNNHTANYNPYRNSQYTTQNPRGGSSSHRNRGPRKYPPKYTRTQKNLDDMLLEGKLSVDEYAMKLSKRSAAKR